VDSLQPELMLHSAQGLLKILALSANESEKNASLSPTHKRPIAVVAIGNGLGRDLAAQKILYDALKLPASLVLDADALNILAARPDLRAMLIERKVSSVVTPHPGEAARLLGCRTEEVQAKRLESALEIARRLRCGVVLKGADSIIVTRDGKTYVNRTGNPGMSTAGMGDTLSGIIAAFIAQGMSADEALLLAVHLHGAAGDALAEQVATIGMSASEVTDWARWLLNQWL
jgi:hydroxyethylthiazole kinase-like uncharacterized protein yjeF